MWSDEQEGSVREGAARASGMTVRLLPHPPHFPGGETEAYGCSGRVCVCLTHVTEVAGGHCAQDPNHQGGSDSVHRLPRPRPWPMPFAALPVSTEGPGGWPLSLRGCSDTRQDHRDQSLGGQGCWGAGYAEFYKRLRSVRGCEACEVRLLMWWVVVTRPGPDSGSQCPPSVRTLP